jgi:hypothetical protein
VLAGVLAIVAASFLIGFSIWAQNVVLESSEGGAVQADQRSGETSGPLVVQDLDRLADAEGKDGAAGETPPAGGEIVLVAGTVPNAPPAGGGLTGDGTGPGAPESVSGHIGSPHPGSTGTKTTARRTRECPPRRVRGAHEGRRMPPGHCRNGAPAGFLAARAARQQRASATPVVGRATAERSQAPASERQTDGGTKSQTLPVAASHGNGHAFGHTKAHGLGLYRALAKMWGGRGRGHFKIK